VDPTSARVEKLLVAILVTPVREISAGLVVNPPVVPLPSRPLKLPPQLNRLPPERTA
jgi:hypothetical protein